MKAALQRSSKGHLVHGLQGDPLGLLVLGLHAAEVSEYFDCSGKEEVHPHHHHPNHLRHHRNRSRHRADAG
jgi:hypothetical protein